MKSYLFTAGILLLSGHAAWSQNVGINTTGLAPAASAMLDVDASNRGLLIPRIALTGATDATTIASPATSLLIYNTATAGAAPNQVTPGYYYWTGAAWSRFMSGNGSAWTTTGNAGTVAATNFIGTTDLVDFVVRSNNLERMRVLSDGRVAVNSTTAFAACHFFTAATGGNDGIAGSAAGAGSAVYGQNTGIGSGIEGLSNNAGGFGGASGNINTLGTGLLVYGNNSPAYTTATGSGGAFNGVPIGLISYGNAAATGTGVVAAGNDLTTVTMTTGSGGAFNGSQWGVYANANLAGATAVNRAAFIGTYYEGTTQRTVYLGARVGSTNYKVLGTGSASVSTTMPTRAGERILFAPESPENWFFDIGEVDLVDGKATVKIDSIFFDCLSPATKYKVLVQSGENTLGNIRVTRGADSFLLEDMGGASNGTVVYSIYGIWKGKENLRLPEYKPEDVEFIHQAKTPVQVDNKVKTTNTAQTGN